MQKFVIYLFGIAVAISLSGCNQTGSGANSPNTLLAGPNLDVALAFQASPALNDSLAPVERQRLTVAERKALEYGHDGQNFMWKGEKPVVSGTVVSFRPFRVGETNCRRFEHRITLENDQRTIRGTACRKDNSEWKLIQ